MLFAKQGECWFLSASNVGFFYSTSNTYFTVMPQNPKRARNDGLIEVALILLLVVIAVAIPMIIRSAGKYSTSNSPSLVSRNSMSDLPVKLPTFVPAGEAPEVPQITANANPQLIHYPAEGSEVRPCVIVCPGGGYQILAAHEGEPIAKAFNDLGMHAFVLRYEVPAAHYRIPITQLAAAVRYVRENAESLNVDPTGIAVCGFSAGGHLTASLGVHWRELDVDQAISCRPDALILCYAVLSSAAKSRHSGSLNNLLGGDANPELVRWFSTDENVDSQTPPAFLWHTADDAAVPASNSTLFGLALGEHQVPYALHIFPKGRHGLGLAPDHEDIRRWPELAAEFLRLHAFKK